jgi:hypothetical protein
VTLHDVAIPRSVVDLENLAADLMVSEGLTPALAAAKVLSFAVLTAEAERELLIAGLAQRLGTDMTRLRSTSTPDPSWSFASRFQVRSPHGGAARLAALERARYEGADDVMKMLLDFTLEDVRHLRSKAERLATAWSDRRDFFEEAERALVASGAARIGDLPPDVLSKLGKVAEEVWS